MRILSILFFLSLGLFTKVSAQVDILNARADPKTFIFDDEKHTVHGYIYNTLKEKTSCCGNDAIYLEVKFDQSGTVTSAKTLTGKNECYKKSIVDIVYSVKWKAEGVSGSKTIYFEVKPIVPCSGSPGENVYKNVAGPAVAVNTPPKPPVVEEPVAVKEVVEEVVEEVVAEEAVAEEEEFLSSETSEESFVEEVVEVVPTKEVIKAKTPPAGKEAIKETAAPSGKEAIKNPVVEVKAPKPPVATTTSSKPSGPIKIPPQEKLTYVSKGDVRPAESHNTTFVNVEPTQDREVKYDNESQVAMNLRIELRKAGFCGLAHAAIEMETDPRTGNVIATRIMKSNDPKVAELVPTVTKAMRFKPSNSASNRFVYVEFKTEMVCNGQKPSVQLETVENYLTTPAK